MKKFNDKKCGVNMKKILVIDDEQDMSILLRKTGLDSIEHHVTDVRGFRKWIENNEQPDIVYLDFYLERDETIIDCLFYWLYEYTPTKEIQYIVHSSLGKEAENKISKILNKEEGKLFIPYKGKWK